MKGAEQRAKSLAWLCWLHVCVGGETDPWARHHPCPPPPSCLQATCVGAKETEATNFLEKKFKSNPQLTYEECVQTAISALQSILSEEFKATEIEVGVVRSGADQSFRLLSPEEVEQFLTIISERD